MPSYVHSGTGGFGIGGTIDVPSPFARDTFQDVAGTALVSHVATPYGGTWTKHPAFPATAVISGSQRVRPSAVSSGCYYFTPAPPSRDHGVSATAHVGNMSSATSDGWAGVACRVDAAVGSMYIGRLFYDFASDNYYWQIGKYTAGSLVLLNSTFAGLAPGGAGILGLRVSGTTPTQIVLSVNGGDTLSYVDSATPITAPGRAGLIFRSAATVQTDTRDLQLVNWSGTGPIMLGADYKPKSSGGFRIGGNASAPTVARISPAGGMRLGGVAGAGRATGTPSTGGTRLGGSATVKLSHAYVISGTGGMRLGGTVASAATSSRTPSGGVVLGGVATLAPRYSPPHSGGFRLGGVAAVTGSRRYAVLATGGMRFGGVGARASGWTLPTSGGFRLGGMAISRDYSFIPSGGIRFGGGKLPVDFRDDGTGGMRFGGMILGHSILYNVYVNDGLGGPVDYTAPIVTTSRLSHRVGPLAVPGDYTWHVRTYDASTNLEEQNIDARVRVILDAEGNDITGQPAAPSGLAARALAAGAVTVSWLYRTPSGRNRPSEFRIYCGTPTVSFSAPVQVVPYNSDRMYWARIPSLEDGVPYEFAVRAANAVAEEKNAIVATATPDATGPRPVDDLVIVAV